MTMPRRKRSTTLVERMIVLAIVAILISAILPNLQRAKRQGLRTRAAYRASERAAEPAGRLNTIEVSELDRPREPMEPMAVGRIVGALVQVAVVVIVLAVILTVVRRRAQGKGAEQ